MRAALMMLLLGAAALSFAGTALVEIFLEVPAAAYEGPEALVIEEDGNELAAEVRRIDSGQDPVAIQANVVLSFAANEKKALTWRYDPANPRATAGSASSAMMAK